MNREEIRDVSSYVYICSIYFGIIKYLDYNPSSDWRRLHASALHNLTLSHLSLNKWYLKGEGEQPETLQ